MGKYQDLLKTTLEKCRADLVKGEVTKSSVGHLVEKISKRAQTITSELTGKGPHGKCPFSSAYEVQIFYMFCLRYLGVWSAHETGKDENLDAAFASQLGALCEVLNNLDTSAVSLPEYVSDNIQQLNAQLKQKTLWLKWFDGQKKKGDDAAMRCLAISKEWNLEETKAHQSALDTIEGSTQAGSEVGSEI